MARIAFLFVLLAPAACEKRQPPAPPATTTNTVTIDVGGMHCQGCAMAVTEAVEKIGGVSRCEVSLEKRQAVVEVDPGRVTPAEIASVIAALGYHAAMPGESSGEPPAAEEAPADEDAPADDPAPPTEPEPGAGAVGDPPGTP